MWNKFFCIVLVVFVTSNIYSQNFLNKTKTEVNNFLETYERRASNIQIKGDTIQFDYIEEDEINRVFDVVYCLLFQNDLCNVVYKTMLYHDYWIISLEDQINQQNAKGEGAKLDIEGETLFDTYVFKDRTIKLKYQNDSLFFEYIYKK